MKTTRTLHSLLGVDKANPLFEVLFDPEIPNELLVHFGMAFLEAVPRDSFAEKLLIARLFNAGFNQRRLHETFHYAIKTMRHWGELLKSGDVDSISSIAEGQGAPKKITEDRKRFLHYLYDEHNVRLGCHTTTYIARRYADVYNETVSHEAIRLILAEKKSAVHIDHASEALEYPMVLYSETAKTEKRIVDLFAQIIPTPNSSKPVKRENSWNNEKSSGSNTEKNSNISPYLATCATGFAAPDAKKSDDPFEDDAVGGFPIVERFSGRILSCHHIGILLSRLLIDFISEDLNDIADIVRQWLAMVLIGHHNIEQGRALNYRALELFIGKQKRSANKQRATLKTIGTQDNLRLLFIRNIRMVDAGLEDTFMLDPHGVAYTGQLRTLKCWLGGSHSVGKGYYLDLIHTLGGAPVFSLIDDNYYDLRQRFVSVVVEFRKILEGDADRFLTFIVDRAIYDVEFMKKMRGEKIHIITWEKNYTGGVWESESNNYPTQMFSLMKYRNRKEDTYNYTVRFFKREWDKEKTFAQYIILLTKPKKDPIELSVICTDYTRSSLDSIKPILTRWLQENDIGYLVALGINQITSYSYYPYAQVIEKLTDRMIDNGAFNKLRAEKLNLKKKLGLLLVDREAYMERKEQETVIRTETLDAYEIELKKTNLSENELEHLKQKIKLLKRKMKRAPIDQKKVLKRNLEKQLLLREKIRALEVELGDTPQRISRIDKLIQEEYIKLNFMPKSLMDAVKITARNIIYQLLNIFRPIWNNYRNDLVILRELIAATGHIRETSSTTYIEINPARQFGKKERRKIELFFFEISKRVNKAYKTEKVIIFSLYEF